MARDRDPDMMDGSFEPIRERTRRNRLPAGRTEDSGAEDFSHDDLINCLRRLDGLEVGHGPHINFTFRSRPFLHFHDHEGRLHADVKFGSGDFEAVPASTGAERRALLDRVTRHVQKIHRARKGRQAAVVTRSVKHMNQATVRKCR